MKDGYRRRPLRWCVRAGLKGLEHRMEAETAIKIRAIKAGFTEL